MATADYGSTDLKDLEAIKPNKKEKRPPIGVDARARVTCRKSPVLILIIGGADGRGMLMLPRGSPEILFE